jgi:transcriptional regulator with XRE-family HTH domain
MRKGRTPNTGAWPARVHKRLAQLVNEDYGSNAAFAKQVGIHDRRVTDWANRGHNGRLPSAENLYAIATRTGCSVDWLLGLSDQRYRGQTRGRSKLAEDVGAHLCREVGAERGIPPGALSADGAQALARLTRREIELFKAEAKSNEVFASVFTRRFRMIEPKKRPRLETPEMDAFRESVREIVAAVSARESTPPSSVVSIGPRPKR